MNEFDPNIIVPSAMRVETNMKDYRRALLRLLESRTIDEIAVVINQTPEWIIKILNTMYTEQAKGAIK